MLAAPRGDGEKMGTRGIQSSRTMNLTAVLSLAVRKIVRYESIGDLIGAKLERGCRLKSRGRRRETGLLARDLSIPSRIIRLGGSHYR